MTDTPTPDSDKNPDSPGLEVDCEFSYGEDPAEAALRVEIDHDRLAPADKRILSGQVGLLDRYENDPESVDPEDMVETSVRRNTGTWYVLAVLARVQGRHKAATIHKMLEGTEWETKKGTISESLRNLKQRDLIDDDGKQRNNTYGITQLGLDYITTKNLTTPGHDLAVADRLGNHDPDESRNAQAAD